MTALWLQSGIGPREAVAKLQPACDGAPLREEVMRELEGRWRDERNAAYIVLAILGGPWNRLTGFDRKDVISPADHTDVVRGLAEITGNQFAVDDVVQTDEPNGDVNLRFVHGGKSYSLGVEGHGRWRNVGGVVDGLNRILEKLGVSERFVELYVFGGYASIVAFVRPDEFLAAARELGIRLESAAEN